MKNVKFSIPYPVAGSGSGCDRKRKNFLLFHPKIPFGTGPAKQLGCVEAR